MESKHSAEEIKPNRFEMEMDFRSKILELIMAQGEKSGKVLSGMNLKWKKNKDNGLTLEGFDMRYKFLPEKKTKESSEHVSLNPGKTLSV